MIGNLNQLRHFITLADVGSFTQAAKTARRSQPAFSRSIAILEAELGVKLFDRIGWRNELTPVGRDVLKHARHIIFEADELERRTKLHMAGAIGHLRIGLSSTPSAMLTRPLLAHFSARHRSMRLTLFHGSIEQQVQLLRDLRLDVLVTELRSVAPASDLNFEHVVDLPTGLLCRRKHPIVRKGRRIRFEDLQRYPIVATGFSEDAARWMVEFLGPAAHPNELITLLEEDIASLLEVTRNSNAIYLGVLAPARQLIAERVMQVLTLPVKPFNSRFAIVRLAGRSMAPMFDEIRAIITTQMTTALSHRPGSG